MFDPARCHSGQPQPQVILGKGRDARRKGRRIANLADLKRARTLRHHFPMRQHRFHGPGLLVAR